MIEMAHNVGALVLVDGAQAAPHLTIDVQALDADFYTFSGHKIFGPTGIGILYGKSKLLNAMPPYQGGGDMIRTVTFEKTTYNDLPYKFEAGTPNIAGGIGLAPLRPALYALLTRREKYGKIVLLYGTRTPKDILFRGELERWRARLDLEVIVTLDHATSEWRGNVGFVTALIPKASFDPQNAVAMLCGPEVMMRYAALGLMNRGRDEDSIYLSMERNMKCGVGFCGHCQYGPRFVCKDGPVFRFDRISYLFAKREV
jgi:hypothetical protein